jgi:hypothetical protein
VQYSFAKPPRFSEFKYELIILELFSLFIPEDKSNLSGLVINADIDLLLKESFGAA